MSWLFGGSSQREISKTDLLALERGRRNGGRRGGPVSSDEAMRLSVAWACRRLRADLVSTMPIDVYRRAGGVQVEAPKPPVMLTPGGKSCRWIEWSYSSQMDLDGHGNDFGIIEERDNSPFHRPSVIRLQSAAGTTVRVKDGQTQYRFPGSTSWLGEDEVWHEKQFTVPGVPVGLSPIAHAAMSMNAALSAVEFAASWFGGGAKPSAHLRNKARRLNPREARTTKDNFKAQVSDGDVFVSGNDWEYTILGGKASEAMFLEQQNASNIDICRYFGVPGDMVDVHADSGTITYANITQRNLQFLIMNLNPALVRREDAFTYWLLPEPRFAKFNRGALLQMDAKTRAETLKIRVDSRTLDVDEAREIDDLPPLDPEQIAKFGVLFGNKNAPPVASPGGTS